MKQKKAFQVLEVYPPNSVIGLLAFLQLLSYNIHPLVSLYNDVLSNVSFAFHAMFLALRKGIDALV
jgi:hypothetical protein